MPELDEEKEKMIKNSNKEDNYKREKKRILNECSNKLKQGKDNRFLMLDEDYFDDNLISSLMSVIWTVLLAMYSEMIESNSEQENLIDTARLWASAKLMFMPTGSNFVKNIFMHHGSVCVVALSQDTQDNSICNTANSHGVSVLYFVVLGMRHHPGDHKEADCDVSLAVRCIGLGIYCAINGHWSKNETFYNCSNKDICV